MALPLPFVVDDPEVQGNFDEIKKQFPLSRRHVTVETPHQIGAASEPAFQNSWVNYDTSTETGLRFWKDPTGNVHVEGVVKSGTPGPTSVITTLPAGYRPSSGHIFSAATNSGWGRVDVSPTGQIIAVSGGATYFALGHITFKQEQ